MKCQGVQIKPKVVGSAQSQHGYLTSLASVQTKRLQGGGGGEMEKPQGKLKAPVSKSATNPGPVTNGFLMP